MGEIKKKQLLAPHEIKEIFANLDEILDVNETMMAELYMKGSMELPDVLDVFETHVSINSGSENHKNLKNLLL